MFKVLEKKSRPRNTDTIPNNIFNHWGNSKIVFISQMDISYNLYSLQPPFQFSDVTNMRVCITHRVSSTFIPFFRIRVLIQPANRLLRKAKVIV